MRKSLLAFAISGLMAVASAQICLAYTYTDGPISIDLLNGFGMDDPYFADVTKRIKHAWIPAKGHEKDNVYVDLKVDRQGHCEVGQIHVTDPGAEKAALKAVKGPFGELPSNASDGIEFRVTFNKQP